MECKIKSSGERCGFALILVLVIAAVGLLFGAGSLLMFQYQCRLRIDRQHEMEKYFAVRSAVQYLAEYGQKGQLPSELGGEKSFVYQCDSGRDVGVTVNPSRVIFPDVSNPNHYCIRRATNAVSKSSFSRTIGTRYCYQTENMKRTDFERRPEELSPQLLQVMGSDEVVTSNQIPRCVLSLDMSPTGRWTDDLFGRRYMFGINRFCDLGIVADENQIITNDTFRLVLSRERSEGLSANWHPTSAQEAVVYVELRNYGVTNILAAYTQLGSASPMIVSKEDGSPLIVVSTNTTSTADSSAAKAYGIQLVGRQITLYSAYNPTGNNLQYTLLDTGVIPLDVYSHYTNNYDSAIFSTNMVMSLEIEGSPNRADTNRLEGASVTYNEIELLEVYPAYEYAISLDYPHGYTNDATVAHLMFDMVRDPYRKAITYDAHGTLNRGWRQDEKDWEEYKRWLSERGLLNTEENRLRWQGEKGKYSR